MSSYNPDWLAKARAGQPLQPAVTTPRAESARVQAQPSSDSRVAAVEAALADLGVIDCPGAGLPALPPADSASEGEDATSVKRWGPALRLVEDMSPSRDQVGDCVVHVSTGKRHEVLRLGTQSFYDHLALVVGPVFNGRLSDSQTKQLEQHARITANTSGKRLHTAIRVMDRDGCIFIDRNDPHGNVLHVSADDWSDGPAPDAPFVRSYGLGEIPAPLRPNSPRYAGASLLKFAKSLGIAQGHRRLFMAGLLAAWYPPGAYPILNFVGSAGSGKSTAANMVAQLLDPSASGQLRNMKVTRDDMAAAAQCYHLLAADNLSKVDADHSDLLCTVASGGEVIGRKLYTNGEASVLRLKNPLIVTSIHPVALRGDLQSRTLTFEIASKAEGNRRSEADLFAEFRGQLPELTGALVALLAAALGKMPSVKDQGLKINHRLMDFALLGESMAQALGQAQGEFLAEMDAAKARAAVEASASDGFIVGLRAVLRALAKDAAPGDELLGRRHWRDGVCAVRLPDGGYLIGMRPQAMYRRLKDMNLPAIASDEWKPRNERECRQAITRTLLTWSALGYQIDPDKGDKDRPYTQIQAPSTVLNNPDTDTPEAEHDDCA